MAQPLAPPAPAPADTLAAWREANPLRQWRRAARLRVETAADLLKVRIDLLLALEAGRVEPPDDLLAHLTEKIGDRELMLHWLRWLAERPEPPAAPLATAPTELPPLATALRELGFAFDDAEGSAKRFGAGRSVAVFELPENAVMLTATLPRSAEAAIVRALYALAEAWT